MEPEKRSLAGIFMSFQSPVEIPGVNIVDFLFMAYNERRKKLGETELGPLEFYQYMSAKLDLVNMKPDFLARNFNEGFSGGERKRNEILQLAVLGADLAILDEIDSGLDVDALRDVGKVVNELTTSRKSVLMITHYMRIFDTIQPTYIHIMASDGAKKMQTFGEKLPAFKEKFSFLKAVTENQWGGAKNRKSYTQEELDEVRIEVAHYIETLL